ncbi:MAG: type II secretion system protein [Patescibacteria group bacterium]|nr:type II secretion system protein [Patescibacteria group bacterium]
MANSQGVDRQSDRSSLVEVVLILGIIAILSFIIVPNFRAMDKMAKEETVKSIARLTDRAIKDWSSFNGGSVPLYLWGL